MSSPTTAPEFSLDILEMKRDAAHGIICLVQYRVSLKDDELDCSDTGWVQLEPPGDDMIEYDNLTPETVIGWVEERLGMSEGLSQIQAMLQSRIDESRSPSVLQGLPWQ
jgi:hypothetical protein